MNILKECKKCKIEFPVNEYILVPIEGHVDYGYDETYLNFICKCPYCGDINVLNEEEQDSIPLETIKTLMERYAHCSSHISRIWQIENESKTLIKQLINLEKEKAKLQDKVTFATKYANKDCLYHHWPLTKDVVNGIRQKRKQLKNR